MNFSEKARRAFLRDFAQAAKRVGEAATDLSLSDRGIGAKYDQSEQ
jgi:hypothetical protein